MSHVYQAVGWNRQKRLYDLALAGGVLLYLGLFVGLGLALDPEATLETQLLRALGSGALVLLHLILAIGPLARLDRRFLPLLYNRRHLGVTCFLLGLAHGGLALVQFHALGNVSPWVSLLTSNGRYESLAHFPFQQLGLAALGILFLMAATSHDFWLANLGARTWKALHMAVYLAYALLVAHVALGVLQAERDPWLATTLGAGLAGLVTLHLLAARQERQADRPLPTSPAADGFVPACHLDEIPEKRARVVRLGAERVAIFRYDDRVSAVSNVCQHQNGPLGEGRIVDGCITCPWHGYQYKPETGASPPPFTERVATYRLRLEGSQVWLHPTPNAPGTYVEPARVEPGRPTSPEPPPELYVGYQKRAPPQLGRWLVRLVPALVLAAAALGTGLPTRQQPAEPGTFHFGHPQTFVGFLHERPYPRLDLGDGPDALLVAPGKHGAAAFVAGHDGARVRLRATLVERAGHRLLEVIPGSLTAEGGERVPSRPASPLGERTLRGEIVDGKCYLGVMRPGSAKPHRDCAMRCLAGGLPPLLAVQDGRGQRSWLLLVAEDGVPLGPRVLDRVAEPVEVRGQLEQLGGWLVLTTRPEAIRRLP
jgi:methionine sulfoxide reductase heme-binding subunit